jgi:hypothetical protein
MWISIFAVTLATSIGLSVAAALIQSDNHLMSADTKLLG